MKKNIFLLAATVLLLGMTSCSKDDNDDNSMRSDARVKSTADLIGTEWIYTMDDIAILDENGDTAYIIPMDDCSITLNFDADYAHFTFSETIEAFAVSADGMSLDQITGIDFEYEYTYATHTGNLLGYSEDEDGNEVPAELSFTYDDLTDDITFTLPLSFEDDSEDVDVPVVFHRN